MATKWALFVHANLSTIPCINTDLAANNSFAAPGKNNWWSHWCTVTNLTRASGSSFCKSTGTLFSRVTLVRNLKSFRMSLISCRTVGRFISAPLLVLDDFINFFTGGNSKSSSLSSESIKIVLRFKDL